MSWLLDTAVLADAARGTDAGLLRWLEGRDERELFLSVLTLGELRRGAARTPDPARRAALEAWVAHELPAQFEGRLLEVDAAVARAWGELAGSAAATGRTLPVLDGLLLATALAHGLTLVSRHVAEPGDRRVAVLNPYSGAA